MIYFWHLFIKWSLNYPTSVLICDIIVVLIFVIYIVRLFYKGRRNNPNSWHTLNGIKREI